MEKVRPDAERTVSIVRRRKNRRSSECLIGSLYRLYKKFGVYRSQDLFYRVLTDSRTAEEAGKAGQLELPMASPVTRSLVFTRYCLPETDRFRVMIGMQDYAPFIEKLQSDFIRMLDAGQREELWKGLDSAVREADLYFDRPSDRLTGGFSYAAEAKNAFLALYGEGPSADPELAGHETVSKLYSYLYLAVARKMPPLQALTALPGSPERKELHSAVLEYADILENGPEKKQKKDAVRADRLRRLAERI